MFEEYNDFPDYTDYDLSEMSDVSSEEYASEVAELDSYLLDDAANSVADDEIDISFDEITEDSYTGDDPELSEETDSFVFEEDIEIDIPDEQEKSALDEFLELPEYTMGDNPEEVLFEDQMEIEDFEEDSPKVLTRNTDELVDAGMSAIADILDAKADDYKDKGYDDSEIENLLVQDRQELEDEFYSDVGKRRK